jgi:hypothetical protein
LAAQEVWGKRADELTLTYFYLADGAEVSRPAGDVSETRARVVAALAQIAGGSYEPAPGAQCTWCSFLALCEAGQEFLASNRSNASSA